MSRVDIEPAQASGEQTRWPGRPLLAFTLRVLVVAVPLAASVGASVVVASMLPLPGTVGGQVLWWVIVLAASTLVLIAGEGVARRLLPLVGLLRLSLLFPGRAPSRLSVARTSSRRELEELADQVRLIGLGADAQQASVTLVRLIGGLDAHDRRTRGHSERVRAYTDLLARRLHLDEEDTNKLRWAALLHDIGKLAVPIEVLNKPGPLDAHEWELIHRHPAEGDRMLGALRDWLGPWALVVLEHHERWDGTGYPAGLAGDDISFGARLVAVADSYDVMTSVRSYQPQPRTPEAARGELVRCSGSQFDPWMVRCFLNISTRHLWWMLGPMTWLAQIPLVGRAAAEGLRRPAAGTAPAPLGRLAAGALVVSLLVPGFGPGGVGHLPPASAGVEAAATPSTVRARPPAGSAPGAPGADRTRREGTQPAATGRRAPEAPSSPTPATPTSPTNSGPTPPPPVPPADAPTRRSGTVADPTRTAPPDEPSTAGQPAPVPAPKPAPKPTISVPTTAPKPGKGLGIGHVIGKGKGHCGHDANGDGIDDHAGVILDPVTGAVAVRSCGVPGSG